MLYRACRGGLSSSSLFITFCSILNDLLGIKCLRNVICSFLSCFMKGFWISRFYKKDGKWTENGERTILQASLVTLSCILEHLIWQLSNLICNFVMKLRCIIILFQFSSLSYPVWDSICYNSRIIFYIFFTNKSAIGL